ncbi:hypothetical protein GCM10009092_04660 [Bowmanella denitrificans]|uniref:Glycosyl transferase family 28 C-terminal domain-containing protein n=1 Tax=Bowmanella denitrificans TaxID=366582 RepID=A0ABN0WP35_9ALTE
MTMRPIKVLFIPVSSPEGIGEYMRSVILADAIQEKWPEAEIGFVLNRHAPYAASCPYPALLLNASPTKCEAQVNGYLREYCPTLVIFDASGRQSQLAQAKALGAKVIFISQHQSKRRRGMKIGRARHTDRHWVVQPEFVIGPPSWLSRTKLKWLGLTEPQCIGPVFTNPQPDKQVSLLVHHALKQHEFVLLNAGSGGHKVANELAADRFAEVARKIAEAGRQAVLVLGPNYPNALPQIPGVLCLGQVNNRDFIALLAACRYAVLSGGDTLLQAIALSVPTLAVPVSKDQPKRIAACAQQQLIQQSACEIDAMTQACLLLDSPAEAAKLKQQMAAIPALNGLHTAMRDIRQLLEAVQND